MFFAKPVISGHPNNGVIAAAINDKGFLQANAISAIAVWVKGNRHVLIELVIIGLINQQRFGKLPKAFIFCQPSALLVLTDQSS